jgi:glycine/D-amino acid oxidase-like deaminating enzyme/nitrite reductase/ring-hydroxylating ferredoxin subunit
LKWNNFYLNGVIATMNNLPKKEPLWDANAPKISFPELKKDLKTEVCIIGAGITGLSVGYKLAKEGKKVVIIDKGGVGFGESGATTALLSVLLDDTFTKLKKMHGEAAARLAFESHFAAINLIEDIVECEGIKCDFERLDAYLFAAKPEDEKLLDTESKTLKSMGIYKVKKLKNGPAGADFGPCLKYPASAQFHPLKYLAGLAGAIKKHGGEIYEKCFAQDIEETAGGVKVKLEGGRVIEAKVAVAATHSPFNDRYAMHTKQASFRTYVIAVKAPKGGIPDVLMCDTDEPYHYVRQYYSKQTGNMLIVGGEDHQTGQPPKGTDPYVNLLKWAREKFPKIKPEIVYAWSGQIIETIDGLAFIGRNPRSKNVYIATGYSGSGMTYGTLAGEIIGDAILGNPHPWAELYNPARKNIKAIKTFMEGGMNVASQYYLKKPKEDKSAFKNLAIDTGTVTKEDGKNIAAYKDKTGKICKYSAVCPHLGCIVKWNDAAKSFDCPCHGSRFDAKGKVLNGPADKPLGKAD